MRGGKNEKKAKAFSASSIAAILKKAGARRISKKAIAAFRAALEKEADDIARAAVKNAAHAGRVVIKAPDVIGSRPPKRPSEIY